jgi:hypothetical protein
VADPISGLSPVGSLFAAFLGFNPMRTLLEPSGVLASLPHHNVATLTGTRFFPELISQPLHHGLVVVFVVAALMMVIAAIASWLAGGRFVYEEALPTDSSTALAGSAS